MAIECYYSKCAFHGGDGPFCYENACRADEDQRNAWDEINNLKAEVERLKEENMMLKGATDYRVPQTETTGVNAFFGKFPEEDE